MAQITIDNIGTVREAFAHVPDHTQLGRHKTRTEGKQATRVIRVRANGAVKTWKTRPGEFRAPFKYGLKECFAITHNNCDHFFTTEEDAAASPARSAPADAA